MLRAPLRRLRVAATRLVFVAACGRTNPPAHGDNMRTTFFLLTAAAVMNDLPTADGQTTYRKPPGVVSLILDAPSPPADLMAATTSSAAPWLLE